MMKTTLARLAWCCLALLWQAPATAGPPARYGCDANPTGEPVGGGAGYSEIFETGDWLVTDKETLLAALAAAQPGQVIFIPGAIEVDLSGREILTLPAGVTLAGTRGHGSCPGARIFSTAFGQMFRTGGDAVRLTGLRFEGAYGGVGRIAGSSTFLSVAHDQVQIDNCEISSFNVRAIAVGAGGTRALIRNNYIHRSQRSGLGYGVSIGGGTARILANRFEYCRHHIASTGSPGSAYEAAWNWIGPEATGSHFDMHGGRDRGDGTDIAGDWMHVHHNTFVGRRVHVGIRGTPSQGAWIHNNWFAQPADAAVRATGNTYVFDNTWGPDREPQPEALVFHAGLPLPGAPPALPWREGTWAAAAMQLPAAGPDLVPAGRGGDRVPAGSPRRLGSLDFRYGSVAGMAYLDRERFVVASGPQLDLWRSGTGERLFGDRVTRPSLVALQVHPDGQRLLLGDARGEVHEWDVETRTVVRSVSTAFSELCSLAYAPSGERVLAVNASPPLLREFGWDGSHGPVVTGAMHRFHQAVYHPDGKSAYVLGAAGSDPILAHYDIVSGGQLHAWHKDFYGHRRGLALSPDGRRLLAGTRHMAIEFDVADYGEQGRFRGHHGHAATAVAYAPDLGRLLTGSRDGSIRLWDREQREVITRWQPHGGHVRQIAVSPCGTRVLSFGGRNLAESDMESGAPLNPGAGHAREVAAAVFMPCGLRLWSASADGTLRLWDLEQDAVLQTVAGGGHEILTLALDSLNGRILAGFRDGAVREFCMQEGRLLREVGGHSGMACAVAYGGQHIFSAGDDGSIRVRERAEPGGETVLQGHRGGVLTLALAADGQHVVSAGRDGTVRLWDTGAGTLLRTLAAHRGPVKAVLFEPHAGRAYSGGRDGQVLEWDLETGRAGRSFFHGQGVLALAATPDGHILFAGGADGRISAWDLAAGQALDAWAGHGGEITGLAVAPDGRTLVSASSDTTLRVWPLHPRDATTRGQDGKEEPE